MKLRGVTHDAALSKLRQEMAIASPDLTTAVAAEPEVDPIACACNGVRVSAVVAAYAAGARDLADLTTATWAGRGPCGGRCRASLQALLGELAADGEPCRR